MAAAAAPKPFRGEPGVQLQPLTLAHDPGETPARPHRTDPARLTRGQRLRPQPRRGRPEAEPELEPSAWNSRPIRSAATHHRRNPLRGGDLEALPPSFPRAPRPEETGEALLRLRASLLSGDACPVPQLDGAELSRSRHGSSHVWSVRTSIAGFSPKTNHQVLPESPFCPRYPPSTFNLRGFNPTRPSPTRRVSSVVRMRPTRFLQGHYQSSLSLSAGCCCSEIIYLPHGGRSQNSVCKSGCSPH